jgi:serine/threonine-protein kinase
MGVDNMIGRPFDGRYLLQRRIGSGGMADVYLARDETLGREVALKILADRYAQDPGFVERFRREASAAAGLNHPNIVAVYDRGQAEGTYYIAMEYLEGPTLKQEILRRAPLPQEEAIGYAKDALRALDFAHRRGVVHRDVKPHNMVLTDDGRLKVTDFGIARAQNTQQMTEVGSIVGTAQYLSPEQARGLEVGPASDIYSMGIVLYEMLSGELPFTGEGAVDIAMKQVSDPPPPLRSKNRLVSPELEQVVMRALAKDPAMRFGSARQMSDELDRVARGGGVSADTQQATQMLAAVGAAPAATQVLPAYARSDAPPAAEREPSPGPRRSVLPWLLVLLLLAASAVVGFLVYQRLNTADGPAVPNVRGQSCAQARTRLRAIGLVGDCRNVRSAESARGKVVGTDPSVGSHVKKGGTVVLNVGTGPAAVNVPGLAGQPLSAAESELGRRNLGYTTVSVPSAKQPFGNVVGTKPTAGTPVQPGTRVTLYVSNGQVKVPDLSGDTCAQAQSALAKVTLTGTCQQQSSTTVPKGQVISTTPGAGQQVPQQGSVTVEISSGPGQAVVPNLINDTRSEAEAALAQQQLVAKFLNSNPVIECTDPAQDGTVAVQNKPPGSTVAQGTQIWMRLYKYMPNDPSCSAPPGTT